MPLWISTIIERYFSMPFLNVDLCSGLGFSAAVPYTQGVNSSESSKGSVPVNCSSLGTSVLASNLKTQALAGPFTLRDLDKTLVDRSTGLPPPNVIEMVLEVWECGSGLGT